jgi:hypothetical protein
MYPTQFSNWPLQKEWKSLKQQPTFIKVGLVVFATLVMSCAVLVAVPLWEAVVVGALAPGLPSR